MTPQHGESNPGRQTSQALLLWCIFFILVVVFNGTIPFVLGGDLHAWTRSTAKSVLFAFVFYGIVFLTVPLVLIKGWKTVRQPQFLVPLCVAVAAITLWHFLRGAAAISIIVLLYLHLRFDLSDYGIRSRGWKGDLLAVALMGLLGFAPALMQPSSHSHSLGTALVAAVDRMFANPAASVENLFYFGFLAERLSYRTGKWLTPPLIGLMYAAHEMTNPEYWYGGVNFVLIFVGVTVWAAVYLWRRGVVAVWLGDGVYRFAGRLL